MDVIGRGIIAGFLATLALSTAIGPMRMVACMTGALPPSLGFLLHFLVGSVIWGAGYALVHPLLRGPSWLRGFEFGVGAWLIVMLAAMPLTRGGLFGLALGVTTPAIMLAVHLAYGTLLGGIFGILDPNGGRRREEARSDATASGDELHPLPR